jgi:hypothetical protein
MPIYTAPMKISDDYEAKLTIWARESRVYALPKVTGLPSFGSKRFRSYEEMNAWKRDYLAEIARRGGVQWTR